MFMRNNNTSLENLNVVRELYKNSLTGHIPSELGKLKVSFNVDLTNHGF